MFVHKVTSSIIENNLGVTKCLWWMNIQTKYDIDYDGIPFSFRQKRNSETCCSMDETCYAKWIKWVPQRQMLYNSAYMNFMECSDS